MHRIPSDKTLAMREAIRQALARATAPMAPSEIFKQPEAQAIEPDKADFTLAVAHTFLLKNRGWPMARTPGGPSGGNLYYNPDVAVLTTRQEFDAEVSPAEQPAKVNDVNDSGFPFDPGAFDAEQSAPPVKKRAPYGSLKKPPAVGSRHERMPAIGKGRDSVDVPAVQVPAGVKCITLSVAGVSIKIELG